MLYITSHDITWHHRTQKPGNNSSNRGQVLRGQVWQHPKLMNLRTCGVKAMHLKLFNAGISRFPTSTVTRASEAQSAWRGGFYCQQHNYYRCTAVHERHMTMERTLDQEGHPDAVSALCIALLQQSG